MLQQPETHRGAHARDPDVEADEIQTGQDGTLADAENQPIERPPLQLAEGQGTESKEKRVGGGGGWGERRRENEERASAQPRQE